MSHPYAQPEDLEWRCQKCDQQLVVGPVTVEYLGNRFTAEMARCPKCGCVHVSEGLAMGKIAEVEQVLEDK